MKAYEDGWDEWLSGKQSEAARAVYDQQGVEGLYHLANKAHVPECVGRAVATLPLQDTEATELMRRGLFAAPSDHPKNPGMMAAKAYVWAMYRQKGEPWLESILTRQHITWTSEAYANLALGLPASPALWEQIQQWDEEAARLYWANVQIHGKLREHWAVVLEKWKTVCRPWSSLELVATVVDERRSANIATRPSAEQVADVLERALKASENIEPHRRRGTMLNHYVEGLFSFLDGQDIAPDILAHLEWGWFQVLENTKRGARTLQSQVTSSPELFVELLKLVFLADGEPKSAEVSEHQRRLAGHAYDVLQAVKTLPGYKADSPDNRIDPRALRDWITRSRTLAQEVGRLGVCDGRIGQILSYAPPSADGSWPCVEVRDLIEEIQSARLERAIVIGTCNQRGVVRRGEGGRQEWDLVNKFRALADKVRNGWPRTARVLDDLAEHYAFTARHWDEQAKRDEYEQDKQEEWQAKPALPLSPRPGPLD